MSYKVFAKVLNLRCPFCFVWFGFLIGSHAAQGDSTFSEDDLELSLSWPHLSSAITWSKRDLSRGHLSESLPQIQYLHFHESIFN